MAPRKPLGFDTVLELGCRLPDVEATTAWGAPALEVRGRMFACGATHKSAEPDTLVVRMDVDQRDALIADAPETYYLKDHYKDYACVLVRLTRIDRDALRDVLHTGWKFMSTPGTRVRTPRARRRSQRSPQR